MHHVELSASPARRSYVGGAVYLASGVVRPSQLWVCAVFTLGLGWATVLRMGRSSVPVALLQV